MSHGQLEFERNKLFKHQHRGSTVTMLQIAHLRTKLLQNQISELQALLKIALKCHPFLGRNRIWNLEKGAIKKGNTERGADC